MSAETFNNILFAVGMFSLFAWAIYCRVDKEGSVEKLTKENDQFFRARNDAMQCTENIRAEIAQLRAMLPANPIAPDWTQPDVVALRKFLTNTETGAKLVARGKALVAFTAVRACKDVMHTTHSAAQAGGMNEMLNWLLSLASDEMHQKLSQPTGDQVEKQTSEERTQSESAFRELLSP